MSTFNEVTKNLNQDELAYLKLLMNPFDSPIIRAPSLYNRPCNLFVSQTNSWNLASSTSSQYHHIKYIPELNILNPDEGEYPILATEMTNLSTTSTTNSFVPIHHIGLTNLTTNVIEFRVIASALRLRICQAEQYFNGRVAGSVSLNNNGWNTSSIGIYSTLDRALQPLALIPNATTMSYYYSNKRYRYTPIMSAKYNEWYTVFFLPSDDTRFYTYNDLKQDSGRFTYDSEYLLGIGINLQTTSANFRYDFEATTVYEICGKNCKGPAYYPNYDVNSMCRIHNILQGSQCYIGDYTNYNFVSYPTCDVYF